MVSSFWMITFFPLPFPSISPVFEMQVLLYNQCGMDISAMELNSSYSSVQVLRSMKCQNKPGRRGACDHGNVMSKCRAWETH